MSSVDVLLEFLRYRTAQRLQVAIDHLCDAVLDFGTDVSKGLFPAAVFESVQCHPNGQEEWRTSLHPIIDVRNATKVMVADSNERHTMESFHFEENGPVAVLAGSGRKVPFVELQRAEAESNYYDELIPSVDLITPHGSSKNIFNLALTKICSAFSKKRKEDNISYNKKRKMAWKITDESTLLFFNGRKALHAVKQSVRRSFKEDNDGDDLISIRFDDNVSLSGILSGENSTHAPHVLHISVDLAHIKEEATRESVLSYVLPYEKECSSPRITHNTTHNTLTLSLPISAVHLVTLFERYKRSREGDVAEGPFLARLAILLIRYSGLCGGDMEKESGWHAAVPPSILHTYTSCYTACDRVSNSIPVECFASPFNATLDHFFSVFPDTDKWFGSLGNFFAASALKQFIDATRVGSDADHKIVHYGLEANPPFDHEVIQACVFQALALLEEESSVALSILLVLPDSTQEIAKKVREPAENSVYCQANRSLPAEECAYVHGAQHQAQTTAGSRKRSRDGDTATVALTAAREDYASQVKLKCPTRLILLQNEKCNTIMAGKDVMQTIQEKWLAFSK